MATKFAIPLGLPAAGPTSIYMSYLKTLLVPDENDFIPFNTRAVFTISATANEEDKKVVAFTGGEYRVTGGMITHLLLPDKCIDLVDKLKASDWPVPHRVMYGPVDKEDGKYEFRVGELIGNLVGDSFTMEIQDQNGFYLNVYTALRVIHEQDFFNGGPGWPMPLSRTNTRPWQEVVCNISASTAPYIEIKGGSFPTVYFNPSGDIPDDLCSFLSNDILEINIHNAPPGQPLRIEISEGLNSMYQPAGRRRVIPDIPQYLFVPEVSLFPFHKPYKRKEPRNGKRVAGIPLRFTISIFINNDPVYEARIQQDEIDLIRQEYLFHCEPFQIIGNPDLQDRTIPIPDRSSIKLINFKSDFFNKDAFKGLSNYDDWIIDVDKVINLAHYMRRKFTDQLLELMDTGLLPVPGEVSHFGLQVTSAWRNPERNEAVGGVHTSDHQFGKALDMRSRFAVTTGTMEAPIANPKNVALHYALFQAGKTYLQEMIARHGVEKCRSLQVMMERNWDPILSYYIDNAGIVQIRKDSKFDHYVPTTLVGSGELDLIPPAAEYASHVHIGWDTADGSELSFPDIPSYGDLENIVPLLSFMNIIVVATEAAEIPTSEQLPLLHVAETLKGYLESLPDAVETLIIEVNDPVEFLEAIGAIDPFCRIKYFFSMGHAHHHGITLKNVINRVVNPDLYERIKQLYGAEIAIGDDDFTQFKLHQFRVSNLRFLPWDMVKRLRSVFRKAEGIFILGCNAGNDQDTLDNTFCEELAGVLGQSVYGAGYYSKVFEYNDEGWQPADITRDDPIDPMKNYVLAPNEKGGGQYFKYIWEHGVPENLHPSAAIDILDFYRESLEIALPDPDYDNRFQTVEVVIDLEEP